MVWLQFSTVNKKLNKIDIEITLLFLKSLAKCRNRNEITETENFRANGIVLCPFGNLTTDRFLNAAISKCYNLMKLMVSNTLTRCLDRD